MTVEWIELVEAIDKVPEFMVFGNWDYKRCVFCKGPRKEHKKGCIRRKVKEYQIQLKMEL